ncbi:MAG: glycoside-pentoside-hexuronide (GPH):cation symporter, partial [Clostridia bacterium]
FYLQNVIFIPALAVGIITAIARVWDAINDPMMGTLVDRTRTKWGKCRPYLIIMPCIICLATILCFLNGRYSTDNAGWKNGFIIAWSAISYIMWGMLYTVGDIPLWSLPGLMTENEKDRSNLLAFARIAAAIGGALGMVSIPMAQAVAGNSPSAAKLQMGFIIIAVVLSLIGTGLFQITGCMCKERVLQSEKHYSMKESFKLMWSNKSFRRILISGILRSPFTLLLLIAMPMLSYYFANNQSPFADWRILIYYGVLAAGIFGGQFIATAVAPMAARKWDKKVVFNISNLASGVGFALLFVVFMIAPEMLTHPAWLVVLFIIFALAGAGTGAIQVIQSLMIADCVDEEEYLHHSRPDGVFFSGQSFITKLSSGMASIIMAVVYAAVGYSGSNIENLNNGMADGLVNFKIDAPEFSWAMFFLCSIPCAIGMILSVLPMLKYELTDKRHNEIMELLIVRRAEEGLVLDEANAAAASAKAEADAITIANGGVVEEEVVLDKAGKKAKAKADKAAERDAKKAEKEESKNVDESSTEQSNDDKKQD